MDPADLPNRRRLPHLAPLEIPNQSILIFVTQVVADRRPLLARDESVAVLQEAWCRADRWRVGRYVVMPDHIHLFCSPACWPPIPLRSWMAFWRAEVTRRWPWPSEKPIWQRDFFDRQLRGGESYTEKWWYVRQNPVRAGLSADADSWPWQGEMNVLAWHDAA